MKNLRNKLDIIKYNLCNINNILFMFFAENNIYGCYKFVEYIIKILYT